MAKARQIPDFVWRWIKVLNRRMAKGYNGGKRTGDLILLLTTTGRKSGQPRLTPLQYEELDGAYYVGSARGINADWVKNILANPQVQVEVKDRRLPAVAEVVTEAGKVADFLALRLERHPRMIGGIMRVEGCPPDASRQELEEFAADKTLVVIHPQSQTNGV